MASTSSRPPKAPTTTTSLLSDHLAKTSLPSRTQSAGSHSVMSTASDQSREGLRREVLRRRKSLSESEFNFLQGIVTNGTEVEVMLVQEKLNDPSLCFDVDDLVGKDDGMVDELAGRRNSSDTAQTPSSQEGYPNSGGPVDMIGQLLNPTMSEDQAASMSGIFDLEASIDTCASGRGKPPSAPMPISPRKDLVNFRVPSHAELYPDADTHKPYPPISDLEQTPLVQNLRIPKSLEGAAQLPIHGVAAMPSDTVNLMTPSTNNTTAAVLNRRAGNPLVDQLWKAHEQGLALTPQQSTKRLKMRRQQSLSALSPMRRYSSSSSRSGSISSLQRGVGNQNLLTQEELRLIKHRQFLSQHHITPPGVRDPSWRHQMMDAAKMMMVLQNASTDSSTTMDNPHDIYSLLLPTDEEIFRRSLQAGHNRPPPPRPFNQSLATKSAYAAIPKPPPPLQRRCSEGVMATAGIKATIQRRPSALRRMTSDGSQRSKSVSFQIQDSQNSKSPPVQTLVAIPTENESNDDDSLSTYASEHPASEILRDSGANNNWGRRDSDYSLNLHKAHPIRQESIGSTASGWAAAQAFLEGLEGKPQFARKDSINSVASLNIHRAHPIRQDSIASTVEGVGAARSFQENLAIASASASSPTWFGKPDFKRLDSRGSVVSLNLHKATPIRQESICSTNDGGLTLDEFRRQFSVGKGFGRRESLNSLASLDLHVETPIIQDAIFKRQDSMDSTVVGGGADVSEAFRPTGWTRRESMSSIASLDLHRAHPISGWVRRDSNGSLLSLSLKPGLPIRKDSIASTSEGIQISEAFREEIASQRWGRKNSMSSMASLNLHRAHPIRQESICSTAATSDAAESFRQQFLVEPNTVLKPTWGRQSSMESLASMNIHHAHPVGSEFAATLEILRNQGSAFSADQDLMELSLNSLTPGQPLSREYSLFSTESGIEATQAFKKEIDEGTDESLRMASSGTVLSSISDIAALHKDSLISIPSLRLAQPIGQDQLRKLESTMSIPSLHPAHPIRQESVASSSAVLEPSERLRKQESTISIPSLHSAHPIRQDSIASSATGLEPSERLRKQESTMNIPSLHPAHPIRQDSIASTATGKEAKERLRKQVLGATIVASEWEGVVLPESWEDKKVENDDENYNTASEHLVVKVQARDTPRPVFMRHASQSEYDEEGMEVAAVDELAADLENEELAPHMVLKTQILVPEADLQPESESSEEQDTPIPERNQKPKSPDTQQRQQNYRHFPGSLTSFGADLSRSSITNGMRRSSHLVEVSASFDESKSMDRFRGVFRGVLPRSISEDELSAMLVTHCKSKPLTREQSDATVYPHDFNSSSWELDTVEGDYDAWEAIQDDYVNGYGGGGTLPFKILGTSAGDVDAQPHVLSPPLMESLQSFFPISKSQDNFWMKFSMVRDGASLNTLIQRARGAKYSVLAIETTDGEVFGAFTTEPWRKTWNYFGGGESFLWRMRHSRKTKCFSIIDQAAMESEIDVYPFTGANQCVQLCTHNTIAVGGGSPEHTEDEEKRDDNDDQCQSADLDQADYFKPHEWGYGLALQADLQHGSSSPCLTFGSPSLSNSHSDGSLFEIVNVELWGLTPCSTLMDAEKLELGRLFLEPSFNSRTLD